MSSSMTPTRRTLRTIFSTALAGGLIAIALPSTPAFAAPDTAPIPLATLASGPTSGTLANGVDFSVDIGHWSGAQGYALYPNATQTWTFNRPVSLRFGLAGLNFPNECIVLPEGTDLETLDPAHTYDPATRGVCRGAIADAAAVSTFTIASPVTDLAMTAVGAHSTAGRGPAFIEVTYDAPSADADSYSTVQDEPVTFEPAENDSAGEGDIVPNSVRLLDGGVPVTTLTNGDGTYTVNTSNGEITFTPAPGFVGTATPVEYRVLDTFGASATASITVEVGPIVGVSMFNGPVALGALGVLALAGGGFAARRRLIASN